MFSINDHMGYSGGFQMTFENGWTISVQWGYGNYCANRDKKGSFPCPDAEIAAWPNGKVSDNVRVLCEHWFDFGGYGEGEDYYPEHVKGWCKPDEVLKYMNMIASFPKE